MKLSLILAIVCASLVSAKKKPKKPKTTTTRILFTPTFLREHFTKGWRDLDKPITCEQCKNICAVAPVPKWLDTYYACIKAKCHDPVKGRKHLCVATDWGVFPKTTANATSTSTSAASTKATSATPSFITVTSTTAPGPTSALATVSSTSTSSVTAKASTATSSSSHSLPPLRPSFITSMASMSMEIDDE
ncbi:hypothetical protein ACQRIT_006704 [Beauveria bassiana]